MDELVFPIIAISLAILSLAAFGILIAVLAEKFQLGASAPEKLQTPRPKPPKAQAVRAVVNDDASVWLREQDEKTERPV